MAGGKKTSRREQPKLEGFKYFELVSDLLRRLRDAGTLRDRAGNRELFYDQYVSLLLLYFFNPTVTSLRGIQEFTSLDKVQKLCGVAKTSLGSLSEAARVFDPELLQPVIAELSQQVLSAGDRPPPVEREALRGLVAVDGTLLKALPRMAWALWQDATHRAVKAHVGFAVLPGVPVHVSVTAGNGPERDELQSFVRPGGFYVADRGYAHNAMFRRFDAQGVQFVIRVQENATYEIQQENPLTREDREAGVISDVTIRRMGTEKHNPLLERPMRIVTVRGEEPEQRWILATNAHHLSAELVMVAYRYRWQVELFFRWLKCTLGCRHLVSQSRPGVTLQVYVAIIATLLISLWTGIKPNKRTYEMVCHYLSGWASLEELETHLNKKRPP